MPSSTKSMPKQIALNDQVLLFEGSVGENRIDESSAVIRGVKILGSTSRYTSGRILRRYSESALAEAAKKYENISVKLDHPDRKNPDVDRSAKDTIGWLEGCKVSSDGVYGNLHYLKTHPFASTLVEIAQRNPSRIGLSHNALGREVIQKGERVVESIESVNSVDLVDRPATNSSLFESRELDSRMTLAELLESIKTKVPQISHVVSLLESDALGMPQLMQTGVPDMGQESGVEDKIWEAFKTAAVAVIEDGGMDTKSKLKKIGEILRSFDRISESPESPDNKENDSMAGESGTAGTGEQKKPSGQQMESSQSELIARLKQDNDRLIAREEVRSLLESQQVACTPSRISALIPLSAEEREVLISDFAAADGAGNGSGITRPASRPLRESQRQDGRGGKDVRPEDIPSDPEEFARFIRS